MSSWGGGCPPPLLLNFWYFFELDLRRQRNMPWCLKTGTLGFLGGIELFHFSIHGIYSKYFVPLTKRVPSWTCNAWLAKLSTSYFFILITWKKMMKSKVWVSMWIMLIMPRIWMILELEQNLACLIINLESHVTIKLGILSPFSNFNP